MSEEQESEQTRVLVAPVNGQVSPEAEHALGSLGRYRLKRKLGQGGMGAVYRAEDSTSGRVVAIKVLRPELADHPEALQRFQKEARLLALVNNPNVVQLLEIGEDQGKHYLVLEFVDGVSLGQRIREVGPLPEHFALEVVADVARGLVEAHERGIVHRDIKPDNILLLLSNLEGSIDGKKSSASDGNNPSNTVKLADFGLARHAIQSESLAITGQGGPIGTPLYMSPEQARGNGEIDCRTDVYAMGATLFHALAGRPPFMADHPSGVIAMHCNEPPPRLQKLNSKLSDGVCQIVEKCLAKIPEERYADARMLLTDLERLLRGEPTSIKIHPLIPVTASGKVLEYEWAWDLESTPIQLWPLVSNTERLNKACGLPAVQYRLEPNPRGGSTALASASKAGVEMIWDEHPFEWIEGRRFGVLRVYKKGVFRWMTGVVELTPLSSGGTRLCHRVRIEPAGFFGRIVAAIEVAQKGRNAVDKVYRRIDAFLTGKLGSTGRTDPFELPNALGRVSRRRLQQLLEELRKCEVDLEVVDSLGFFLSEAPLQEVSRIRPIELAHRLQFDPDAVIAAFLHAARIGLLALTWDILCPRCRVSCRTEDTIRALREHGHCPACNLEFELDFANSVEMIFRIDTKIRPTEVATYCLGGPAHSPHVVAQIRVAPRERFELVLTLPEGSYRLRGPQLPFVIDFQVETAAPSAVWNLELNRRPEGNVPALKSGNQLVVLINDGDFEVQVRIERMVVRNALTAARAMGMPLFRQLFPSEMLAPGQLLTVANVTLVAAELGGVEQLYGEMGDAQAVTLIHGLLQSITTAAHRYRGTVAKTSSQGILLLFDDTLSALTMALELSATTPTGTRKTANLRMAIHRGPTFVATVHSQVDYFGQTVYLVQQMVHANQNSGLLLTKAVASDPDVVKLLNSSNAVLTWTSGEMAGVQCRPR